MRTAVLSSVVRALLLAPLLGCATCADSPPGDAADLDASGEEIASLGAWYHLDSAASLGTATLTVANGYQVRCPSGEFARTCRVRALALPPDCDWECQDGLLSLRGEGLLKGQFDHDVFVAEAGLDTYTHGLGTYSVYRITGAATCTSDPCPTGLRAQKLNLASQPTAITAVDFSAANDPNYVLDPTRGDDQVASTAGLLVSGRILDHVFRVDRTWRLETPKPVCDPQLVARGLAGSGGDDVMQFRTEHEAERFVGPDLDLDGDGAGDGQSWVVRSAQTPTTVTFTTGRNDLWSQKLQIDRTTCAVTVVGEH